MPVWRHGQRTMPGAQGATRQPPAGGATQAEHVAHPPRHTCLVVPLAAQAAAVVRRTCRGYFGGVTATAVAEAGMPAGHREWGAWGSAQATASIGCAPTQATEAARSPQHAPGGQTATRQVRVPVGCTGQDCGRAMTSAAWEVVQPLSRASHCRCRYRFRHRRHGWERREHEGSESARRATCVPWLG